MAEPSPNSTKVVEEMSKTQSSKISNGRSTLDRDVAFVMGQAEMPLTVYESPLMVSYREFQSMKRDNNSDGYYLVQRKVISNEENSNKSKKKQRKSNLDQSIEQLFKDEGEESEVLLLYGRGPVFKLDNNAYADRYLGFDD